MTEAERAGAVATYISKLHEVFKTGAATPETSHYPALTNLLDAVGETLRPRRFAVSQLADAGAGHPDYGIFDEGAAAGGGVPTNVLEAKPFGDATVGTAQGPQVSQYAGAYDAVLVTNYHQFLMVAKEETGKPRLEQAYALTETPEQLLAANPRSLGGQHADGLFAYLALALSRTARIRSGEVLATVLASHAREALVRLETEPGADIEPLRKTLEQMLGLSFADDKDGLHFFHSALVQTLFYGLFSAWVLASREQPKDWLFDWRTAADQSDIPLIGALFAQAGQPQRLAKLGLREPMDWAQAALNRVDRSAFHKEFEEHTAIQYFYEPFLHAFDPLLRKELGVWYTPPDVVRYQVQRVHTLLQDELGLAGGLANEKVVVLDPAVGTGSYLLEVARTIHEELASEPDTMALAGATAAEALKNRVFGFELLPAPFVVSHLQLQLFLAERGIKLASEERVGVFLTNSLTGWKAEQEKPMPLWDETFDEEREQAARVKLDEPILVILGNPPYARYTAGAIAEERDLIALYKGQVDRQSNTYEPSLLYRWTGVSKQTLDDLYIRFFRIAERRIEARGVGIVSYISNSGWLTGASNPIMRESLLQTFERIWIDDLHGGAHSGGRPPDGEADGSVFAYGTSMGISIAVAITTMVKTGPTSEEPAQTWHRDIWGTGQEKRKRLLGHDVAYDVLTPRRELRWMLRPVEESSTDEFFGWRALNGEVFRQRYSGVHTGRDSLVIHPDKKPLEDRMARYYDPRVSDAEVAQHDPALMQEGNEYQDPSKVRKTLLAHSDHELTRAMFRPFDIQWMWWERHTKLIQRNAEDVHDLVAKNNPLLITDAQQYKQMSDEWDGLYVTNRLPLSKLTQAGCKVFPMLIGTKMVGGQAAGSPNIREELLRAVLERRGDDPNDAEQQLAVARDVFYHSVAVLQAPAYRRQFQGQLAAAGARVPVPVDRDMLEASANIGRRVATLFDRDAPVKGVNSGERDPHLEGIATLQKGGGEEVGTDDLALTYGTASEGGRWQRDESADRHEALGSDSYMVLLNDRCAFKGIPAAVESFSVGQYPVLRKWLSYRRVDKLGRPLTLSEARTFIQVARRIGALLLMREALDENFLVVKTAPLVEPPNDGVAELPGL